MKDGWEDTLVPLTTRQSIECYDTEGQRAGMYLWAMYGLGLKSLEDFDKPENQYSLQDVADIAVAVMEATHKGKNPTNKG